MSDNPFRPATPTAPPAPNTFRLYIGHMVCPQCLRVVRRELEALGWTVAHVALGVADIQLDSAQPPPLEPIRQALQVVGFTLLDDVQVRFVEQLKALVVELIHYTPRPQWPVTTWSVYLSGRLGKDYPYLSQLFSTHEGLTLEKFIIRQKIERAKELLSYQDASVAQIARQLGYSSSAYLTNQFRQVTGVSPSEYQRLDSGAVKRRCLDDVT